MGFWGERQQLEMGGFFLEGNFPQSHEKHNSMFFFWGGVSQRSSDFFGVFDEFKA